MITVNNQEITIFADNVVGFLGNNIFERSYATRQDIRKVVMSSIGEAVKSQLDPNKIAEIVSDQTSDEIGHYVFETIFTPKEIDLRAYISNNLPQLFHYSIN